MKTITVKITDKAFSVIKTTAAVSFLACASDAHIPIQAMIKIINAVEEGKAEMVLKLKEEKDVICD
jgi:hypothetical protein